MTVSEIYGDGGRANSRATACFRVMGETLLPERVSAALEVAPDQSHRKGDERVASSGRRYSAFSEGLWVLESSARPDSSVDKHIRTIVKRLRGKELALQKLKQEGFRMDLFVGVFGVKDELAFSISDKTIAEVARLGLTVEFAVYGS